MIPHANMRWRLAAIAVWGLFFVSLSATAQEKNEAAPAAATEPEAAEASAEPGKIPINLKDAPIDQIVKFLSDKTGKVVFKSKDVQAKITISCPEPVTTERAIELIGRALRLEGVVVLELDDVIYLVPEKKLAEMPVQMVEPLGKAPRVGFVQKVIPIKFADVLDVEGLIKPLLPEGSKLVADPRTRKIIITAPAHVLINLESVIGQLDVLEMKETQVRIFQLKHAVAEEIAPILETILQNAEAGSGEAKGPSRPGQKPSGKPGEREVTVVAYKAANWILVRAPKEKLEAAAELIKELDRERPRELELNVILLTHAEARDLARQLSDLFRRRPRKKTIGDTVELTADDRANALIVLSSTANFELIKAIIAQLDTEEARQRETRSYPLKYADAEDAAEQLNDLYSQLSETYYPWGYSYRRRDYSVTARFVPERRTNTLIVIAAPTEFEQIEALINRLDQPISEAEVSPRIYHIRNIDAKELTDVLNQIFGVDEDRRTGGFSFYYRPRTREREVGRLYGKVRFVHEPTTNSVVVITNNKENFPIIEALIESLDRTTVEYANTMVYELENADAADLADQLNSLFALPGAGGRPQGEGEQERFYSWLLGTAGRREEERPISNLIGQVRVVPDTRTNSLLITTAVQNREVLGQLIKELDREAPKVLIKVRLVEIIRAQESRIGTRLSSDVSIFESRDLNSGLLTAFGYTWEEITTDSVVTADVDLALLIQFLLRNFNSRVLSQPWQVVNDNKEARIFVGSEVPFITTSIQEPGTTAEKVSFDYKKIGTELVITPRINRSNKVVTTVQISASQIREGETLFGGVITDTREYSTEVAVESGQTLVIGGIMRHEEGEVINRVPILGRIPVLKLLFSKKDKTLTTTELIAFITPTVLRKRADDDAVTSQQSEELEGLDLNMPGRSKTRKRSE